MLAASGAGLRGRAERELRGDEVPKNNTAPAGRARVSVSVIEEEEEEEESLFKADAVN